MFWRHCFQFWLLAMAMHAIYIYAKEHASHFKDRTCLKKPSQEYITERSHTILHV